MTVMSKFRCSTPITFIFWKWCNVFICYIFYKQTWFDLKVHKIQLKRSDQILAIIFIACYSSVGLSSSYKDKSAEDDLWAFCLGLLDSMSYMFFFIKRIHSFGSDSSSEYQNPILQFRLCLHGSRPELNQMNPNMQWKYLFFLSKSVWTVFFHLCANAPPRRQHFFFHQKCYKTP